MLSGLCAHIDGDIFSGHTFQAAYIVYSCELWEYYGIRLYSKTL